MGCFTWSNFDSRQLSHSEPGAQAMNSQRARRASRGPLESFTGACSCRIAEADAKSALRRYLQGFRSCS
jgi:hypothetical protein